MTHQHATHCSDPDCHDPHCDGQHEHPTHCSDPDCHDPHCDGQHEHAHHCADPDCHDPHCDGQHEHAHHCADPDCHDPHCDGHHHTHEGPEHAAVFAAKRDFAPASPVSRAQLEAAAEAAFTMVGETCCIDGILPGHAKGLIEVGDAAYSLSLTCADHIDVGNLGGWDALNSVSAFTVTINIHLIIPRSLDEDAIFAPFAAL